MEEQEERGTGEVLASQGFCDEQSPIPWLKTTKVDSGRILGFGGSKVSCP